ncbi:hypothetical protein QZH41_010536, partial [Actinostola sp. cb2023]
RPIFSVDIHPDGSRFATGGQGDDCGKVAIWNMGPLKSKEEETNNEIPRLLCQMDNHLACVNCVRWSNNGKYLASGGDDNLVMIWQMARYLGTMTSFGGGGGKLNIEQWRCVHNLRQHNGEVIQVLKGHTGLVKGVTWDPVGKYLASQADDKTLRVWRTSDWQQEASVTEPFSECSGTTHVLRLSWSPDGHYVVSAHAMNNSGPVAKILERDGWKTRMDFVGHRKAITCVVSTEDILRHLRFNPKLFVKKVNGDSSRLKQYSCCAIGCRDRSLSIWLTSLKRPLVVVHDLFNHSVMDMSWSQTGFELLVCSWDGTVAYADFSSDELGKAMSQEEKEKFHKQVYGISISSNKTNDMPLPFGINQTAPPPPPPSSTINSSDFSRIPTSQSLSALHSRIGEQAITGFKASSKDSSVATKAPIPVVKATSITPKSPAKSVAVSHQASPSKPSSASTTSSTSVSVSVKRKGDTPTSTGTKRVRKDKDQASRTVSSSSRQKEDRSDHDESATSVAIRHTVCIPSPAAEKTLTVQIGGSGADTGVTIELENNLSSSVHAVHVLKCSSAGKVSWEAMVTSPGIALAGNRNVVCIACLDKSVSVFSFGGKRLMPALVLDAPSSMLQCNGHYIMVVTSSGGVYVWDSKMRCVIVKNESTLAILSGHDVTIARASISERGYPVITLSNQSSYSFEPEFGAWTQLVRAEDPLALNADYKSTTPRQDPFEVRGTLSRLQGQSTRLTHQGSRLFRSNPGRQQTATVSHL